MCGICGVVRGRPPDPVDENLLRRMRDVMVHRGPDDAGLYILGNIGLGHRRLSIIDLSGGHQPMSNAEGTLWVTYNGESYNFHELRAQLESKGYVFSTKSDTEVILHAYAEFGERCVDHFRGMFAFGLWDQTRRQLLLARDRLGIKPLYYTVSDGTFLFASEVKAILQWPGIRREVDPTALREYLRFRYVPGPRTMFRGISKLQAGHILTFGDGKVIERLYWDIPLDAPVAIADPERQFLERLQESVRLRLISEVPLGVFLSGGVDSSTIVALMAPMVDEAVQTFSVGYPDGGSGSEATEFAFARMAAKRSRTNTYVVYPGAIALFARLRRLPVHRGPIRPSVSVLIVAHNEAKVIRQKLENCLALKYPREKVEIVVASDGSTDATVEIAREYERQRVTVIGFEKQRGKTAVLNDWLPRALGEIVVLADARQQFEPSALRALVEPFADPPRVSHGRRCQDENFSLHCAGRRRQFVAVHDIPRRETDRFFRNIGNVTRSLDLQVSRSSWRSWISC